MRFTIEDAINGILRNSQDFNRDSGDDFYIGVEGAFDNAPLGVDINIYTGRQEEGCLPWTAVAYPLVEVRGEALTPDYGSGLLGFNFQFTNDEKNEIEAHAFCVGNCEGNSEAWYDHTKFDKKQHRN